MSVTLNKPKYNLPETVELKAYDRVKMFSDHSEELLMEAALNAWEYILENGCDDSDLSILPNFAGFGKGVVELRHAVIYMAPSILSVYDELLNITDDLPCYDLVVVPCIVRYLDKYLDVFDDCGMDCVIGQSSAILIAKRVKNELVNIELGLVSVDDISVDDSIYNVSEYEDRVEIRKTGSDVLIGYVKPCFMTVCFDIYAVNEKGTVTASESLKQYESHRPILALKENYIRALVKMNIDNKDSL